MPESREFRSVRAPRAVRLGLSLGAALLLVAGLLLGLFFGYVSLGVMVFAVGAILLAVRGYLATGDRAVAGALIFVALTAIGTQLIVLFLAP